VDAHDPSSASLATGYELAAPAKDPTNEEEEDELEYWYPTQRQYFQFAAGDDDASNSTSKTIQKIRTTSFGCGKLGHQVWPSSIVLSLVLMHDLNHNKQNTATLQSVLELGAGCGLPSVLCRDVLQIPCVIATDFWYSSRAEGAMNEQWESDRLVPEHWHGVNLEYNVVENRQESDEDKAASIAYVRKVDWHDLQSVRRVVEETSTLAKIDLVIGSDIIYYPMDMEPLWNTLETLLKECFAQKVILVSPLKQNLREALPAFEELLATKSSLQGGEYLVERQEFALHATTTITSAFQAKALQALRGDEDGDDRFVKWTLSLRK
jgi:predicted nicotinamide N-methyase